MANQVAREDHSKQAEELAAKLVEKDPVNAINIENT